MATQQDWYVSEAGRFVYAHDETIPVARMLPGPNMGARGKLIAAAPDMLAALRKCADFIESLPYEPSNAHSTRTQDLIRDILDRIDGAS